MTLSGDISTTSTSLNAIKQAIIAKGVTPTGNITTYATAIGNIQTGGLPGWTTLSSIGVDCSISEIVDYIYETDAEVFQQNVASIIPANSMYISTTTVSTATHGITVFIINDVNYFFGSVDNNNIYIAYANTSQPPEFQYSASNYRIIFSEDIETTIANGETTITDCGLEVYDVNYGSYQLAAVIDLTFHFNV